MTIVPRTGPLSASSALATTSWYQRGKSSAWGVRTGALAMRPEATDSFWGLDSARSGRIRTPERGSVGGGALADQLDAGLAGVGVGALVVEQGEAVGLGFGGCADVRRGQPGVDALGHQALGLLDERLDHLVLGHDPHDLAADEQV